MLEKITCPKCKKTLSTMVFNIETNIGRCDYCACLFSGSDIGLGQNTTSSFQKPVIKEAKRVSCHREGSALVITRSWYQSGLFGFLLLFGGIFFGVSLAIMTPLYLDFFKEGKFHFAMLFPHPFIGIGALYYASCVLVNKTRIVVDGREVKANHGPLPWFGSKSIARHEIESISLKEYTSYTKNNVPVFSFSIEIHKKGGAVLTLLKGISEKQQALYIEQNLESFMGLADKPELDRLRA
jgi:hypothetical protein